MGQEVTRQFSFAIVVPWNGIVLVRAAFGKGKKMPQALVCSYSLIRQGAPMHSPSTRNTKVDVSHLSKRNEQVIESV